MNARFLSAWLSCICLTWPVASAAAQPPDIPVARPVVREITDHEVFTGRTEAVERVDLRARVSGYLLRALFQEGADVKRGELLFEIDPRPYRAELDRAEAAVALAEARLKFAEANHKRLMTLRGRGGVSQEDVDKVVAERAEAEASVRAATASRAAARLYLDFTQVRAPIAGRIGRRLVDPGNLVKADDTHLAVLVSRDPMYAYFDVDERTLLRLLRLQRGGGRVEKMPVDIALPDETAFPHRAVVSFINNRVDPQTGSVSMRAVLPNKDGLLSPGMFVRVRLAMGAPYKALLVPDRAVLTEDGARFVFVVNAKNVVEKRSVTLGQQSDGLRIVKAGLKAEDRVVVGGLQRLRPGLTVRPRLQAVPERQPAKPRDGDGASAILPPRGSSGPGILVEAVYPGANAEVVSESVRAPIEQQVGSMERLRFMRSRCGNDGTYTLALRFTRGTDLQFAQVLAQNRVNLALPLLPEAVTRSGVSFKRGTSGVLLVVNLFSPNGRYERLFLGNYAKLQVADELSRVAGVGEVSLVGHADSALRVWLDPDRLAAFRLNAGDVTRLLAKEKGMGEMGTEKIADLILRTDGKGRVVRLKDVGTVELGASRRHSEALLDGKPAVALVIQPTGEVSPQQLRAALRKRLAAVRQRLPEGLALDTAFDFAANLEAAKGQAAAEYLLLDVDLPLTAGAERIAKVLSRCGALLQQQPGVEHVLALSENPFDLFGSGPCVLVRLAAEQRGRGRDKAIEKIRERFAALADATLRIRNLAEPGSFPGCGYPIDLALAGPDAARVRNWARELGERLGRSKKLTDVWVNRASDPQPQRSLEIDREAAVARGVSPQAIFDTLQVYAGALHVADTNRFGRTWRVEVQTAAPRGEWAKGLRQVKLRNSTGQMIPLSAFVKVGEIEAPLALDFLDYRPMVEIAANPARGVSVDQARKLCEALAAEARNDLGLPAAYRLTWLHDTRGAK